MEEPGRIIGGAPVSTGVIRDLELQVECRPPDSAKTITAKKEEEVFDEQYALAA